MFASKWIKWNQIKYKINNYKIPYQLPVISFMTQYIHLQITNLIIAI